MSGKQLDEFGNKIKFIRATFNKIEVNITDIFILINFNWVSIDPFKYLIFFPSSIYLFIKYWYFSFSVRRCSKTLEILSKLNSSRKIRYCSKKEKNK